jgi:hypothetical protein
MMAVTPLSIASCGPSGKGKKASEAMAAPSSERSPAFSTARRTESTRLIWPAPIPVVARSFESTIALERTCLHTFQANPISLHSCSVGRRWVTTCISERSSMSMSRSWTSRPPITRLVSRSDTLMARRSLSSSTRRLGLPASTSSASSS